MKWMLKIALVLLTSMAMLTVSCSDDSNGGDDGTDPGNTDAPIVGTWKSAGTDVAPLLLGLGFVEIDAVFRNDQTYTVTATDTAAAQVVFTGTYTATASGVGNIMDITLNQNSPTAITSVGIYEIDTAADPDRMTYEVVQTEPTLGVAPPTAAAGFGSTGGGVFLMTNVQYFVRQ